MSVLFLALFLQRNHTLFGKVWSSLRRKNIGLSGKGGLKLTKAKKNLQTKHYDDDEYDDRSNVGARGGAEEEEEERAGVVGERGFIGINVSGDSVNSMTRVQQNIPMRPLVISDNNKQNYDKNISQNVPATK